jgi:iron complex transport system ATP-binding protein
MEIARHIAYLPQSRTVPDITVERLVLHGRFPWLGYPRVYRRQDYALTLQAMEWAGIAEARKKVFAALSGGERQRAYLAMLLAQDADTVLLDEPATYLDITYQLELIKLLNKLKNKGKAVVAVLHDLHMALDCADVLAVMQRGRLLALETPTQILASGALEQAFGIAIRPRRYDFTLPPGDA